MTVTAMKDRRCDPRAPLSKSLPTPQPEIFKAGSATQQQQQHQTQPFCGLYHASHTKTNNAERRISSHTSADASTLPHQHLAPAGSTPATSSPLQPSSDRGGQHPPADTPRSVSVSAPAPPSGRKLKHIFGIRPTAVLVVRLYVTSHRRWWW